VILDRENTFNLAANSPNLCSFFTLLHNLPNPENRHLKQDLALEKHPN
jgi:hypothetical protein